MKLSTLIAVTAMVSFASVSVGAQERTFWFHERSVERQNTARSVASLAVDTAFGDRHSLYNGSVEFTHVDISIPGNSALPVELRRKLPIADRSEQVAGGALRTVGFGQFADWDLDIPHLSGTFLREVGWQVEGSAPNNRCSSVTRPRSGRAGALGAPHSFWNGYQLNIPGMGTEPLLGASQTEIPRPADGATYYWLTKSLAWVSCKPSTRNGHPGEAFLVTTPDGFKYHLDHVVISDHVPHVTAVDTAGTHTAQRRNIFFVVSRVEDRFGNWVNYTWNGNRLQSITSNDGRSISITYDSVGRIIGASTSGHQWQYIYNRLLSRVVLPDNSEWNFSRVGHPFTQIIFEGYEDTFEPKCHSNQEGKQTDFESYSVRHPSGALAEFSFAPLRHHRSNTPFTCMKWVTYYDYLEIPNYSDTHSLIRKRVTGPGLQPAEWTYEYALGGDGWGFRRECEIGFPGACPLQKTQRVYLPNGERIEYDYGLLYEVNEGQLLATRNYSTSNVLLRTITQSYVTEQEIAALPFPARAGSHILMYSNVLADASFRPEKSRTIHQQGVVFSSLVNSYDRFARPVTTTKSSGVDGGVPRTEQVAYHDNLSLWVLGRPAGRTVNGTSEFQVEYTAQALPSVIRRFGRVSQSLTYNANGTIATLRDGNNRVTTLSNWKRGNPQTVQFPATPEAPSGATQSAVVNDRGWITSVNDELNSRTCYAYDAMGRITTITYTSEAATSTCNTTTLAATTASFVKSASAKYGLPAGHWQQTVSTGNGRKITYFDALWRPVVEEAFDSTNSTTATATRSVAVKRYDTNGRLTFQSYPMASLGNYADTALKGSFTTYDALDRPTHVKQDWEGTGQLTTTTEYLGGFQVRTTNPRQVQTITQYQAFDQPIYDFPTGITTTADTATEIHRNIFGKTMRLVRRNHANTQRLERLYAYNGQQELCRTEEPETGATLMGYDGAGNLTWSAAGLSPAAAPGCHASGDHPTINPRKATRTYDARNRLHLLQFADGRGNQEWIYAADGLPVEIRTSQFSGGTPFVNKYSYNRRRLLTGESQAFLGDSEWFLTSIYNANGHLASSTYPSGHVVGFEPNALGQPTRVGTYATNVTYFPNGAPKQFTYGNGIQRTVVQNLRGLSDTICDAYGACNANAALNDGYDYDQHANLAAISDGRTGARGNRTMVYDPLDRLTQAISPMFGTSVYNYDVLDNLTRVQVTGGNEPRDHHYCYDTAWRLTNVKLGSCSGASVIGIGYDVQGNVNNKNGLAHDFDLGNRLRRIGTAGFTAYTYDAHGRRVTERTGPMNPRTITSMYDLSGILRYERHPDSLIENYYLNGTLVARRSQPLGIPSATAAVSYQHTDLLGSPVATTNEVRSVIATTEYEPYGRPANRLPMNTIGFTGHREDVSGLVYMQQRYYDPQLGVFLSVDPVTAYENPVIYFHRYRYAANNPYKYVDPDGRIIVYDVKQEDANEMNRQVEAIKATETGAKLLAQLEASPNTITVSTTSEGSYADFENVPAAAYGIGVDGSVAHNLTDTPVVPTLIGDLPTPPEVVLAHELAAHGLQIATGSVDMLPNPATGALELKINPATGIPAAEERAIRIENSIRREMGIPIRTGY